jgi:hypothetical protein
MRVWSKYPANELVELADLAREPRPELVDEHLGSLKQIVEWAEAFLCNPHPDLGRSGPVCPFVRLSMEKGLFWLSVAPGADPTAATVAETVMRYRDWFLELEPVDGREAQYKTILILFPDVPHDEAPRIIDTTQRQLKPHFVARGLMIGQFHMRAEESGLWNDDFRPLHAPVPLLAIRHLVPTDFPFLKDDPAYVEPYLSLYGQHIPKKLRAMVEVSTQRFGLELPS